MNSIRIVIPCVLHAWNSLDCGLASTKKAQRMNDKKTTTIPSNNTHSMRPSINAELTTTICISSFRCTFDSSASISLACVCVCVFLRRFFFQICNYFRAFISVIWFVINLMVIFSIHLIAIVELLAKIKPQISGVEFVVNRMENRSSGIVIAQLFDKPCEFQQIWTRSIRWILIEKQRKNQLTNKFYSQWLEVYWPLSAISTPKWYLIYTLVLDLCLLRVNSFTIMTETCEARGMHVWPTTATEAT